MKKILFSLILFCVATCLSVGIQSCKKNNDTESSNIELSKDDDTQIEEFESETIDEKDLIEPYQSDAATKILSIVPESVAAATEDESNNCQTFRYAGHGKIAEISKFTITLSQTDTLIDTVYTNKPNLVKCDFVPLSQTSALVRTSPTTYDFWAYQADGWDTLKALSVRFSVKTIKNKVISKTIKCVGVDGNGQTFGTSAWGNQYYRYYVCGNTAPPNPQYETIDTSYVPQKGDLIRFKNGSNYKFGVITSTPILTPAKAATATKPAVSTKYRFRISEMNNRECKSSKTNKSKTLLSSGFPSNIQSIDATYTAEKYKRF